MPTSPPNPVAHVRGDGSQLNAGALTRRELRERERTQFSTLDPPIDGPSIDRLGTEIRPSFSTISPSFSTISIAPAAPMTLDADRAPELPVPAIDSGAVHFTTSPDPVAQAAPPVPEFPSRRALRQAAQKAAAEKAAAEKPAAEQAAVAPAIVETVAVEALVSETAAAEIIVVETVAADTSAGIPSGFSQKAPPTDRPQPVVLAPSEVAGTNVDVEAPTTRREARAARPAVSKPTASEPTASEANVPRPAVQSARTKKARPAVARAPRPSVGPAPRSPRRPARSRARTILAKSFPLVAMTFVAGLMIATSTPAAALLSQADVSARSSLQASAAGASVPREGGQSYTAAGGDTLTVVRDGYETSSVEKIAQESGIRMEATYTNNPNGTIQWPFPVGVHIGDQFGPRSCAGCSSNHRGQDFNPGDGAPIQSIADGVVRVAENGGGSLGVHMIIDHQIDGRLVSSVYAHMQYDTMRFEAGDTVKVGEVIGITGTTGMSTGPHLHFEIRLDGDTNVDPLQWLYNNTN